MDVQDRIKNLDSAFAKAALRKEYIVYRGLSPEAESKLAALTPGQVVSSHAYLSATASLKIATRYGTNLMRIALNKGTPAISMSVASKVSGDVLLRRDQPLIFDGVGRAGEYKFHAPETSV